MTIKHANFNDVMNAFEKKDNMNKNNGFVSGNYEVCFLQDDRLTVCVIRHSKHLDEIYTGVSVLHPKEKFDEATGRHKAFKKALKCLYNYQYNPTIRFNGGCLEYSGSFDNMTIYRENCPPISQLQKDYWKRYGKEEK